MALQIRPIQPGLAEAGFVGEVAGIDLTAPLDQATVAALEAGMDRYAVLVFHDQRLTDEQQMAFTRRFGAIEEACGGNVTRQDQQRLPQGMNDVSNLGQDNQPLARDDRRLLFNLGNQLWHSDSSFRAIPAKYSLLSCRLPANSGGNTEFADMRAAYDALDDATRGQLADLICEHSLLYSRGMLGFTELTDEERAAFRPVRQSLVRTHPVSGRRSLYLSSHIGTIVGWPRPEALAFIRDLAEHATQAPFVYVNRWRQWDLVMWDNRQTRHRVRRFDDRQKRDMRRTTVAGDAPTAAQIEIAA